MSSQSSRCSSGNFGWSSRGRHQVVFEVVDVAAFGAAALGRPARAGSSGRIVGVGSLIRRKGFHDLIEALRLLIAAGCPAELSLIGDGPERAALEAQAQGLPVTFHGTVPRATVIQLVHKADVFAMPTLADPFGIAAVEGLAAGVPTVVTSASGAGRGDRAPRRPRGTTLGSACPRRRARGASRPAQWRPSGDRRAP